MGQPSVIYYGTINNWQELEKKKVDKKNESMNKLEKPIGEQWIKLKSNHVGNN